MYQIKMRSENNCLLLKKSYVFLLKIYKMRRRVSKVSNTEIGNRIKVLREGNKISREELADKAGISTKFLYEVENGKKGISAETLLKISQALCYSCDYILTGENKNDFQEINDVLNNFNKKQLKSIYEILKLMLNIVK